MTQTDIYQQIRDGEQRRDRAIAQVGANAPEQWNKRAIEALQLLCRRQQFVTTDDLWAALGDDVPPEPRAIGSTMTKGAKRKWLEKTDRYTPSVRPDCHRRPIRMWRSLTFLGVQA